MKLKATVHFHNCFITHLSTLLKLCNNVKFEVLLYILNDYVLIFCCTLKRHTYFDVLTNILKHMITKEMIIILTVVCYLI